MLTPSTPQDISKQLKVAVGSLACVEEEEKASYTQAMTKLLVTDAREALDIAESEPISSMRARVKLAVPPTSERVMRLFAGFPHWDDGGR